jgi:ribosome-binding factor A
MISKKSKFFTVPDVDSGPRRRPARIADLIRNEVALLLIGKIKDPRIQNATITSVKITNDLRTARIFYSVFRAEDSEGVKKGLASAKGFIRSHLAKQLNMRYVPELEFNEDFAARQQENIVNLLKEIEDEHGESSS